MHASKLFTKWRQWLNRIYDQQLLPLLVHRQIFHQFRDALWRRKEKSRPRDAYLANWIVEGYVAFASTTIRRMTEVPNRSWESISLVILLEDLKTHDDLLTRRRFRRMCPPLIRDRFANEYFDTITRRRRAPRLTANRIQRDIVGLKRAVEQVKRLVDKVVAHTEFDRRCIGKTTFGHLDRAIDAIERTYRLYSLLLGGATSSPPEVDVRHDLQKIWPN
jgi:hypothetical protein